MYPLRADLAFTLFTVKVSRSLSECAVRVSAIQPVCTRGVYQDTLGETENDLASHRSNFPNFFHRGRCLTLYPGRECPAHMLHSPSYLMALRIPCLVSASQASAPAPWLPGFGPAGARCFLVNIIGAIMTEGDWRILCPSEFGGNKTAIKVDAARRALKVTLGPLYWGFGFL